MNFKKNLIKSMTGMSIFLLMLGTAGCAKNEDSSADSKVNTIEQDTVSTKSEENLVLHLEGGDTGLPNPFKHAFRGPGMAKMWILYDSLLEKDENGDIPWLAKSWDVSEDGTVYTFHMEENALWHDGTPLTAKDVEFTFSYYKEHSPISNVLLADGEYIVKEAIALDDYTIEVTLNHFDNTYLTKIGSARILPKHIWENVSDPASFTGEEATIGSGPYMLESYDAGQGAYRYVAFEDYWGLTPAATAIEWIPVSDSVLAFENQQIDLINATADILANYEADAKYTVKTGPSYHSYRLMMNMEVISQLQDNNLRKAIAYGIDRQELVDKVKRGSAVISSMGYVPTYSEWYNQEIEKYDYNQEKALELLEGKTYNFKLLTDNSSEGIKAAELIQLSLEKIGVGISVESVDSKALDNAVSTGQYEIVLYNSGGLGGDPDYLRTVYGKTANTIIGWSNEEIFTMVANQATEQDVALRKDMIFQLQEKIADEVPMIMLYGAVDNFVYQSETYDGWMFSYDHSKCDHNKLSYVIRK